MTEDDKYVERARTDHYLHLAAVFFTCTLVWRHYGFWIAAASFVALYLVISLTNIAWLALTESVWALRINRWGWVAAALAVLFSTI